MKFSTVALAAIATLTIAFAPLSSQAQIEWLNPEGKNGVQSELSFGTFPPYSYYYGESVVGPTSTLFFTARMTLSKTYHIILEASSFHVSRRYYWYYPNNPPWVSSYEYSHSGFASPYIGFEFSEPGSSFLVDAGIRPALITSSNSYYAAPLAYMQPGRRIAYWYDATQFSANVGYRAVNQTGHGYKISGGGQLSSQSGFDPELFLAWSAQYWIGSKGVRILTSFSGMCWATQQHLDLGQRFSMNLGAAFDFSMDILHPGIHVQAPLRNNLSRYCSLTYGAHLSIEFSRTRH